MDVLTAQLLTDSIKLVGISGRSHDTRELMRLIGTDDRARLSLEIFVTGFGSILAHTLQPFVVLKPLSSAAGLGKIRRLSAPVSWKSSTGLDLPMDPVRNEQTVNRKGRITTDGSRLHAYVIPVEEGLLIANQMLQCLKAS